MRALDELHFVFVTGKGGVGKSTVSAALASRLASEGRRVLITSCDLKERLSSILRAPALSPEISRIQENLWGVHLTPETAMREYGSMILKSDLLYKAVFENRYVRSFFAGVPGLYEWAMLGKAWFHSTEEDETGRRRFDVVIFDAPATGHGLDMLRVPKVIVDIVPPGILRRDAERAWRMFQDPKQSGVVIVTLPEDMPTNETAELRAALNGELRLPIVRLIVNGVMEPLFSGSEQEKLLQDRQLDRNEPGDEAIAAGVRRAIRQSVQEQSLKRLTDFGENQVELPFLPGLGRDPQALEALINKIL